MKEFYEVFNIPLIRSFYCKKGKERTCPVKDIPRNCNKCNYWNGVLTTAEPPITLGMYLELLEITMTHNCIFAYDESNKFYMNNASNHVMKYADTLNECILKACIEIKEECYEEVRKVFGIIETEKDSI